MPIIISGRYVGMQIQSMNGISNSTVFRAGGTAKNGDGETDSALKGLESQIQHVQEQLQSLAENQDMSVEMKMERRKELQDQLAGLRSQLMQRRIQVQQEKRDKENRELEAKAAEQAAALSKKTGSTDPVDTLELKSLVSADKTIEQVETAESVRTSMTGRAGVLAGEIAADAARGVSVAAKSAELAGLNAKISGIETANAGRLSGANEEAAPDKLEINDDRETKKEEDAQKKRPNTQFRQT